MASGDVIKLIDVEDRQRVFVNVSDYGSLNTCVKAVSGSNQTILIASPTTLTSNLIVPPTIELIVTKAGLISAGTFNLTINGTFSCGLYQAFSGTGTVTFNPNTVKESCVEWFGTVGDGVTDDTVALQKAINSNSVVKLSKSYRVSTLLVTTSVKIYGGTLIQVKADELLNVIDIRHDNVTISDMIITGPIVAGNSTFTNRSSACIYLNSSFRPSYITIENCTLTQKLAGIITINYYTTNLYTAGSYYTIRNNTIRHACTGIVLFGDNKNFSTHWLIENNDVRLAAGYDPTFSGTRGIRTSWVNNCWVKNNTSLGACLSLESWASNMSEINVIASIKTFNRNVNPGWVSIDKYQIGDTITFRGFKNKGNNGTFTISNVTDTVLTCSTAVGLVNENALADYQMQTNVNFIGNTIDNWLSYTMVRGGVCSQNYCDYALLPAIYLNYYAAEGSYEQFPALFEIVQCDNIVVDGNILKNYPGHGIFTDGGMSFRAITKNSTISNNTITNCANVAWSYGNNSYAGMYLNGISDSTIIGNTLTNCGSVSGGYSMAIGGQMIWPTYFSPSMNLNITGNIITGHKAGNLLRQSAVMFGCTKNVEFSNNTITRNFCNGINIGDGSPVGIRITNCNISNNQGSALATNANCREVTVENCYLKGNILGGLSDGITSTPTSLYVNFNNNVGFNSDTTIPNVSVPFTGNVGQRRTTNHATNHTIRYTVDGTHGTLTSFGSSGLATTTLNSAIITVNPFASYFLLEGQYITIAGVTGIKKIVNIDHMIDFTSGLNNSVVTLDSTCSASVTNAQIIYSPPTTVFN